MWLYWVDHGMSIATPLSLDGVPESRDCTRKSVFAILICPGDSVAFTMIVGPIPWGHNGPLCHALSSWTSVRRRRATVQWRNLVNWREAARCGEWAQHFSNASCLKKGPIYGAVTHVRKSVIINGEGHYSRGASVWVHECPIASSVSWSHGTQWLGRMQ